jgi:DNA-binding NtrC family response regulator
MKRNIDVALVLWNPDVIQLMSHVLCRRNLASTGIEPSEGMERITDVIASSGAPVVVFDLDPPYARSAAAAKELLNRFPDRGFVMTCADPLLAVKSAPWLAMYSIFQKPYETDDVVAIVSSMIRRTLRQVAACSFVM